MNELILSKLKGIEEEYQVKVLYAVESGSRAWGVSSKTSDYDVRFIYIHHPNWYLSIDPQGIGKKRDVIELPIHHHLDINGWEMTKALRLFRKSNPPLFEWLRSPIVYYQYPSFIEQLRLLESEVFNPSAMLHHYLSIAKNNYRKNLGKSEGKLKIYFYILHSLFSCRWIEKYKAIPPMEFQQLLQSSIPEGSLKKAIEQLAECKKEGNELQYGSEIPLINDFINNEIPRIEMYIQTLDLEITNPTEKLDHLFREILKEVWGRES